MAKIGSDIIIAVHILDESYARYLRECISSIHLNTEAGTFRIICVQDRGWEGTEALLGEYKTKGWIDLVLRNDGQRGWTRTNNVGLEVSEADCAVLLNMDTVVSPGWLEGLIDCSERNRAAVVGCKLVDEYGRINHAGAYGVGFHKGMGEPNISYFDEEPVEWVTGACMLIRKWVRLSVGLLPEEYPHWGSDREYCKMVSFGGDEVWYSPVTLLHYTEKSKSVENDEYFKDMPR